ncbi:hypothetical protein KEM48_002362 [Puccinia striiformis f. sp. tritici PST-130]|nr:hypothetical protein KEM48_002362 [Puccinia striiformis f. sp. tritici PST-130]
MPSHLRNGRDLSYEQRQRALEYQLSPAGAARLQRLGGQSATPGRQITIVGPGRTASGSRDKSGLDQLERDVPSSRIEQRDVSAAGIHQVHASTATSGQGELPSNPPTDPDFGADRHSSSSYSAHSDPLNGLQKFDGYYTRASGPEFLGNNSQQSMGNVRPSPRLPGHLDDEIFSQRGRRNPRDDPEQSRPRGNDPTQSGLERPRGTSSFGRAIPASEHPDAESRFTSGTPHGRLPPSSQQQQRRNAATTPAVGVLDESIYATPASFIAPSVPALSATGPDGPRLRTSTPLSPKRLRNQPVPTPSSRKLERIREEQEKTPERDSRSAQDGPIFHARRGRDGTHPTRSPNQNPSTASSDSKPPSSPPLNGSLLPILDNLSDASQRESMLRNINNEFLNDNPFLIEDKLHTLFSKFLSELSGTLESVPSTLLKSCVQNLSFTVNSAVVEAIKSTVIPSLLDKVLEQLRVSESELKPNQNNFDLTSIQSVISGKIEDLHDCMLVNESQRQADSDELKSTSYDFKEENMRRFNSINDQIGDLQINEHNRFELIQRRLGDICSTLNKVNDKVNSLFEPDDRDPAPHLTHNNPLMNNHQHFSIQEPAIPNQPTPEPAQKTSKTFSTTF